MGAFTRQLYTAAIAAAATYFLDAQQGRRRRALLRDKLTHAVRKAERAAGITLRDGENRLQGLVSRARVHAFKATPDESILAERVRSQLGRVVSHPGAIEVRASDGRVTLEGAILEREHEALLTAVRATSGVVEVDDALTTHAEAGDIPSLQGGRDRTRLSEWRQHNWSPTLRTIVGTGGLTLAGYGLRHKGFVGFCALAAGSVLIARAAANRPVGELSRSASRGIDVQKTITVNAPIDRVFDLLSHYENFPQFMRHVRKVEPRADGTSRWTVEGPAGVPVQWDSKVTQFEPNQRISWRTLDGAPVENEGSIQLEEGNGGTRITIRMRYHPPAGALGHFFARMLHADARTELDDDMLRLKSMLETGRPARDAAAARGADRRLQ
jgi:uncharacterized membrane protein